MSDDLRRTSSEEPRRYKTFQEPRSSKKQSVIDKMRKISVQLGRTKSVGGNVMDTNLKRCLTTFDVTLLSIGHMVGSGVYVLTPTVAKRMAGPAIVLSYLFSGVASFLAALCYAELGVRYPRSGSAYSYTYLALGEMWAFLVGWNVALENILGVSAIARSCSAYVDSLTGYVVKNSTSNFIGEIDNPVINDLDFLALGIVILFIVFLSFGVQMTSGLNNTFSVINICSVCLVIGVGCYFAELKNWTNEETGGFMPYGWGGVFQGAATCFYAYVGFDSIAAAGEEAKNPTRSIPLATMISMGVAATAYVCVGAVLTLMISYKDISLSSGLPDALDERGAHWAKIVVIIGAVCGMSTGIIGSLFALTRVIYAMAEDGLLFPICARVHSKTKIPLGAMCIFGSFAGIMSFLLDVEVLSQLMSIGTLFAYLVVSSSVIVIRYKPDRSVQAFELQEMGAVGSPIAGSGTDPSDRKQENKTSNKKTSNIKDDATEPPADAGGISEMQSLTLEDFAGRMKKRFSAVDKYLLWTPGRLVTVMVVFFVVFTFMMCLLLRLYSTQLGEYKWWAILVAILILAGMIFCMVVITQHQQSTAKLGYKVPLVPLVPALSIMINAWLIANFLLTTFIRLLIWIAVGLVIYFCYGIRHSKLNEYQRLTSRTVMPSDKTFPIQRWNDLKDMLDRQKPRVKNDESLKKYQSSGRKDESKEP